MELRVVACALAIGFSNADVTARVHRRAAEAILAIAAEDDPAVKRARAVLGGSRR